MEIREGEVFSLGMGLAEALAKALAKALALRDLAMARPKLASS